MKTAWLPCIHDVLPDPDLLTVLVIVTLLVIVTVLVILTMLVMMCMEHCCNVCK